MSPTTETALLQRIDALTKAVQHLAQTQGALCFKGITPK